MEGHLLYADRDVGDSRIVGVFDPPNPSGTKYKSWDFDENHSSGHKGRLLHGNDGRLLFTNSISLHALVYPYVASEYDEYADRNNFPRFEVKSSLGSSFVCEQHDSSHVVGIYVYGSGHRTVTMKCSSSGPFCKWSGEAPCVYKLWVGGREPYEKLSIRGTFGGGAKFRLYVDSETYKVTIKKG